MVHDKVRNRFDKAMNDPYNLKRFVDAQAPVIDRALTELRSGEKRTHWMWFVFPQIEGLGHSEMSRFYAISSLDEAEAYVAHPVLGPRLRECTQAVLTVQPRPISHIFGHPDDLKFHSSMTLFARTGGGDIFRTALERCFAGVEDFGTLSRL